MKKKINIRLVGIAVLAILATVIGTMITFYNLFQEQVRTDLIVSARLLRDTHCFDLREQDTDQIDLAYDLEELRVTWIDSNGTVLYDNGASKEQLTNHMDRPEIARAFSEGIGESVRRSDTMNKNTYYYAILLDNGTVLRVATDAESLLSVFLSATPVIALIILVIITVCVIISHLLTKQLIRPIENMVENLDTADYESPYRELDPLSITLKSQHTDILVAAKARQDFTTNISHELKTPLTAILGYAQLLEGGVVEEDRRIHFIQEIYNNANRLLALIDDVIKLSELDRSGYYGSLEDVDLYEIATECMKTLSINSKTRGVNISLEGEHSRVHGNADLLRELLENLGQNAIRYNKPGGMVRITVENRDGRTVLIVKDNGIGIPASEQQRVFERFYRVDKSRSKATGGTGLGLAIVKHIVEIHGATIELDSAPNVGTTVTVKF